MRTLFGLAFALLLLVGISQAALVNRRFRELKEITQVKETAPLAIELRPDQIPVAIVEVSPEEANVPAVQAVRRIETKNAVAEPEVTVINFETVQKDVPIAVSTSEIAENIAKEIDNAQNARVVNAVLEAERQKDDLIVEQQVKEATLEENKELLSEVEALEKVAEQQQLVETAAVAELALKTAIENKDDQEVAASEIIEEVVVPAVEPTKALPAVAAVENVISAIVEQQPTQIADKEATPAIAEPLPNIRQATQATPTQTTAQQNPLQQFIQNNPISQFFNQLTGNQQQAAQVAADELATPQPTLPGFLNPAAAITSAQQALQNVAQTVVNQTQQAFQGVQQFASSVGNQIQSTLSNFPGGQQTQLTTSDSTTTRRPGPIQSLVSNFIGGTNQQAGTDAATTSPQQQGPLQGVISFFQGGNRPQAVTTPVVAPPKGSETSAAGIDDKVEQNLDNAVKHDEIQDQADEQAQEETAAAEEPVAIEADATNEVTRNSAEDSFEEAHPDELIVVNDDAAQQEINA